MWKYIEKYIKENGSCRVIDCESGICFTNKEILEKVDNLYNIFAGKFVEKVKCAILCRNEINAAIALLACWKAELVPVIMSMNYGINHCNDIVSNIEPDVAVTDCDIYMEVFDKYTFNMVSGAAKGEMQKLCADEKLTGVTLLMSTSGTTGKPKGVMISKKGLIQNVEGILQYFDINEADRILISRPLYHCAVLTGEFLTALVKGLDIVFYSGQYNPLQIKVNIEKFNVTVMCGTPTLFSQLALLCRRNGGCGSLKRIALSGECMTYENAQKIRRAFQGVEIYNVYGLTENSPRVSFLEPKLFDKIPESVGVPLKDTEIFIVDEERKVVQDGIKGQIIVKSPSIMKGYYNNVQATEKKIIDGCLQTGDVGYKDEDGFLYVVSRMDDMIIKAGLNIYPLEIENLVLKHPAVKECMAYGINKNGTQLIGLDIVLTGECSLKELQQELWKLLPTHLYPEKINIVKMLQKNASGKLVRKH